jgi:hypothetical protein
MKFNVWPNFRTLYAVIRKDFETNTYAMMTPYQKPFTLPMKHTFKGKQCIASRLIFELDHKVSQAYGKNEKPPNKRRYHNIKIWKAFNVKYKTLPSPIRSILNLRNLVLAKASEIEIKNANEFFMKFYNEGPEGVSQLFDTFVEKMPIDEAGYISPDTESDGYSSEEILERAK